MREPNKEEIQLFAKLLEEYRYDFERLAYIIWPFGEKGSPLENEAPYEWQLEELRKLSSHLSNPLTRFEAYRLIISSGNGAAKTALGAMITILLLYTQRLRGRITANTDPQIKTVVWPEYDRWFRLARYNEVFFEKLGTSIKSRNEKVQDTWRIDTVTWSEESPASMSGLHNKGGAVLYVFEEAPGIPAVIWQYASGAFTETETIKVWLAFGNSDDPESKFEQNMTSPLWHSRRIDTRELTHIDQSQVEAWLLECGGDENHDDFRVRVKGLPRKTSKDSIIGLDAILAALARRTGFDRESVKVLPCILTCDPAWTGGDETTIWFRQGQFACLLEKYRLDKSIGQDHMFTFLRLCHWERQLGADAVFIDQGEGTAIYTLANNSGRNWELVSFAASPIDTPDFRDSQYSNIRAQMYYEANHFLLKGGILESEDPTWIEAIKKQLPWTKGGRHKVHGKKLAEAKLDIKKRVGSSPDVADGFVLCFARPVLERKDENMRDVGERMTGDGAWKMPDHPDPYSEDSIEADYTKLYD